MTEHIQLKTCPFCGSAAKMEVLGGKGSTHRTVQCTKCKCDLHWQATEKLAIEAWNTRASDEQVRKLRGALTHLRDELEIRYDGADDSRTQWMGSLIAAADVALEGK